MKPLRTLLTFASVASTFLHGSVHGQEGAEAPPASIDELLAAIEAVIDEREMPSVGLALVNEDGPAWVGAIGKANIENDLDADENSLYRIGSTSKMFVSLAVLKLVDEGRLSLDDKLSDLAPEIVFENEWEETDPVRLVHLLEHTTGWDDIHLPEYAHNEYPPVTLKEGLDFHPHSRTSRWIPGSRMSYCNAGPPVAARVIENVTGQDFEQYVIENFFEPMGMETMTYQYSEDVHARGVTLYSGGEPQDYWHIIMRPSGSINASPKDMAKLAMFFVNRGALDGEQLVSRESIDRMERADSTSAAGSGQETGYGLGNFTSIYDRFVYHGHDGGVNGGLTELAYLPDGNLAHVIMINSGDYEGFRKISELVRGFETRDLVPTEPLVTVAVSEDHKAIPGLYYPINPRQQVGYFLERVFGAQNLWIEGEKLVRKSVMGGETVSYLPVSQILFREENSGVASLSRVRDPLAGDVIHIGMQVLKPAPAIVVYGQIVIAFLWAFSIVSAVLYFLVWGVRRLRGKIAPGPTIDIRLWPLLASVSAIAVVFCFAVGMSDPFSLLGALTTVSVTITFTTMAFFLFAMYGAYTSYKERNAEMNRVNYWYSTITSWTHFVVALYLLSFGIIGLMTWA